MNMGIFKGLERFYAMYPTRYWPLQSITNSIPAYNVCSYMNLGEFVYPKHLRSDPKLIKT